MDQGSRSEDYLQKPNSKTVVKKLVTHLVMVPSARKIIKRHLGIPEKDHLYGFMENYFLYHEEDEIISIGKN